MGTSGRRRLASALLGVAALMLAGCNTDPGANAEPPRPTYAAWLAAWKPQWNESVESYTTFIVAMQGGSIKVDLFHEKAQRIHAASVDLVATLKAQPPPPSPPTATTFVPALVDMAGRLESASASATGCVDSACGAALIKLISVGGPVLNLLTRPSPDATPTGTGTAIADARLTAKDLSGGRERPGDRPDPLNNLCIPELEGGDALTALTAPVDSVSSALDASAPARVLQKLMRFATTDQAAQYFDTIAVRSATCPVFAGRATSGEVTRSLSWKSIPAGSTKVPVVSWRQDLVKVAGQSDGSVISAAARLADVVVIVSAINAGAAAGAEDDSIQPVLKIVLDRLGVAS